LRQDEIEMKSPMFQELTNTMIEALRREARAHDDLKTVHHCALALQGEAESMRIVCDTINTARAMDDSVPLTKVIMPQ
jgi:hypothetical protein